MDVAPVFHLVLGFTNVLLTLVSFWIIDRYGRKPLYIVGFARDGGGAGHAGYNQCIGPVQRVACSRFDHGIHSFFLLPASGRVLDACAGNFSPIGSGARQ